MKISCGLLMYVNGSSERRFLLVHPGGPYWRAKDEGAWSIPKGLPEADEDLLTAAKREFVEETNLQSRAPFLALTPLKQKSGKLIHCWAFEGDGDLSAFRSEPFEMEWPPRSGRSASFPEADRAELFPFNVAQRKIHAGQRAFLVELEALLSHPNTAGT